jgi:hypothetical protein
MALDPGEHRTAAGSFVGSRQRGVLAGYYCWLSAQRSCVYRNQRF